MSTSMRRQLERLQADLDELKPKPLRPVRLIASLGPDATEEQRKAYAEALAWSKAQGGGPGVNLIAFTPMEPTRREIVDGVMHVGNEVEAHLTALALQPSENGKATRLDDVMASLSGNVIGAGGVMQM